MGASQNGWTYLTNAYEAVPHALIKKVMEFKKVQSMVRKYYDLFKMRFTTGTFTTEGQALEVEIAADVPYQLYSLCW